MLQAVKKPRIKVKVCTIGEEAVGKTSLIRRFVADKFDGDYIRTIGTLISKKTVEFDDPMGTTMVADAIIWDIMGRKGFMDLLKDAYFYKANGVLAVCDITRKDTLDALRGWLDGVYSAAGPLPVVLMANKWDLRKETEIKEGDVLEIGESYDALQFFTSAKTGENVFSAFESLLRSIVHSRRQNLSDGPSDEGDLVQRLARP